MVKWLPLTEFSVETLFHQLPPQNKTFNVFTQLSKFIFIIYFEIGSSKNSFNLPEAVKTQRDDLTWP